MSSYRNLVLIAVDAASLALCAALSWWLKALADPDLPSAMYLQALPLLLTGGVGVYAILKLYPAIGISDADELKRLSQGSTILIASAVGMTFLGQSGEFWSRQIFLTTWLGALIVVPVLRGAVRRAACRLPWWGVPTAVLGAGATGERIIALLRSRPWLGLRPVVVLDDDASKHGTTVAGVPVADGILAGTPGLAAGGIRHAILAVPGLPSERLAAMLDGLGDHLRHVFIAPALPGLPDLIAETREFANTLVLEVRQNLLRPGALVVKRSLDLVAVVLGLLLFWWVLVALAMAVRLTSKGAIFYGQRRIGHDGRSFTAWKFRSMVKDADAQLQQYLQAHPELREEWERDHKLRNDPRVTMVGRLLRRTSLDELPQVWNVITGEMSLVGPRPIVQAEIEKYGARFPLYTKVRPGLSGLWQVSGRNDTTYAERVALDCYYVRNWSVWLDLVILARTTRVVLWGKGAY